MSVLVFFPNQFAHLRDVVKFIDINYTYHLSVFLIIWKGHSHVYFFICDIGKSYFFISSFLYHFVGSLSVLWASFKEKILLCFLSALHLILLLLLLLFPSFIFFCCSFINSLICSLNYFHLSFFSNTFI